MLLLVSVATAQDVGYPESIGGILKKGDSIGIVRSQETGVIRVTIFSDQVFDILRETGCAAADQR